MINAIQRAAVGSATAILIAAALAGCSGSDADAEAPGLASPTALASPSATAPAETTPAPSPSATEDGPVRVRITYANGKVTGGVAHPKVPLNSTIKLTVTSDVADEVHVHGYDKKADVEAGESVTLTWVAKVPGTFEVELESKETQIAEIAVR